MEFTHSFHAFQAEEAKERTALLPFPFSSGPLSFHPAQANAHANNRRVFSGSCFLFFFVWCSSRRSLVQSFGAVVILSRSQAPGCFKFSPGKRRQRRQRSSGDVILHLFFVSPLTRLCICLGLRTLCYWIHESGTATAAAFS